MKTKLAALALAGTLAVWSAPVAAQTLTGTWQITSEGRRGAQTITIELVQNGSALTGTATFTGGGRRGGGGGGGQEVAVTNGTVDGSSFSFDLVLEFGGNAVTLSYSGTYEGDSMEGTRSGARGGGQPFTGKREG